MQKYTLIKYFFTLPFNYTIVKLLGPQVNSVHPIRCLLSIGLLTLLFLIISLS